MCHNVPTIILSNYSIVSSAFKCVARFFVPLQSRNENSWSEMALFGFIKNHCTWLRHKSPHLCGSMAKFHHVCGLYALFLKGQGHQGIFSLVKGTLWGNFFCEHFKGTKAMTRGHGGNRLCCVLEVAGLCVNTSWNLIEIFILPLWMELSTMYMYMCKSYPDIHLLVGWHVYKWLCSLWSL